MKPTEFIVRYINATGSVVREDRFAAAAPTLRDALVLAATHADLTVGLCLAHTGVVRITIDAAI